MIKKVLLVLAFIMLPSIVLADTPTPTNTPTDTPTPTNTPTGTPTSTPTATPKTGTARIAAKVSVVVGYGSAGKAEAMCGANEVATGGGFSGGGTNTWISASYPIKVGSLYGWHVEVANNRDQNSITAYAVCSWQ